ncbi:FolC protein [Streptococcus urinalis FB127-CNA-2]|uniref:tetrahydrofolate synthase n=1 Tax=Streptococcus urinalis 2285-97 TaxID=764291 RepID=G5KFP0_9STRE|nr:folylpolyglutamate synthase/dihydrofolate synthase family protein [Streptococcus urinalis]EHJ57241.1 bifunctional protein FolC [Streptococcus urinalis 2285-97]EKS22102.1 FolC protein [Streptococcus urinalis FB127-CNA-2]VEF31914.1 folylpolyglutamate synthase [Streptococcus urinalis]
MTYEEVLDWIHSQLKFGIKPGIERVKWLLNELGNPHQQLTAVHVVGTNGKGSTVNYLQTIFSSVGYEVGSFTSPYIMDFRERISLNGNMISKEDLVFLANHIKPIVERLPIETGFEPATEFEIITVMMCYYFGKVHPVDIAFIEAGLGGLYDSTNVFHAKAVICPSIGLDHQDILGKTYQEIAHQKVGVLTAGEPFIFATEKQSVEKVFLTEANEKSCPTYQFDKDFFITSRDNGFDFEYKNFRITNIVLDMKGKHQMINASLVIMTCLLLNKDFPKLSADLIKLGLEKSHWLGRTELLSSHLMIDGAHNRESVEALVKVMQNDYSDKKIHILFSAINTKPIDDMLAMLEEIGELTVTSFHYPRAVALDQYPQKYRKVTQFQDWLKSYQEDSETDFYLITGSLYFISEVRQYWLKKNNN